MCGNLSRVTSGFEEKTTKLGCRGSAWIFNAKQSLNNETKQLLEKSDNIVGKMPEAERLKLKQRFDKIIPLHTQNYKREYDDQLLETLVELLG